MSPTIRQQLEELATQIAGGPIVIETTYTISAPTMLGVEGEADSIELALTDYLAAAIYRLSCNAA